MKVLGVCGLGNTGSFAIIDLLREYQEVFYNKYLDEFPFCYTPDGLLDLKYHLVDSPCRYESCDAALFRFEKLIGRTFCSKKGPCKTFRKELKNASYKYINSITDFEWKGTWSFRYRSSPLHKRFFTKVLYKLMPILGEKPYISYTNERLRYSYRPDDFLGKTQVYLENILNITSPNNVDYVLVDQLFPGDNPELCFQFFKDPYAIVVDRDPRDLYILSKCEIKAGSTWIPTDNVEDFIAYYKIMREKSNSIVSKKRVLKIQYEDLIYEYDKTKKKIENFLNISRHLYSKKHFLVEDSINNTQLFIKHPEFKDDVEKIKKELGKWLFDYSKYPTKTSFGKTW